MGIKTALPMWSVYHSRIFPIGALSLLYPKPAACHVLPPKWQPQLVLLELEVQNSSQDPLLGMQARKDHVLRSARRRISLAPLPALLMPLSCHLHSCPIARRLILL